MHATLVLEDGTVVEGEGFGAEKEVVGEAVFNTSMSGYQEALTDPSYSGQILMLTYPMIGNYGVNTDDFESDRIRVEGFVVREKCIIPSHRSAKETIDDFLRRHDVPGVSQVDTRALTIKIRTHGTMKAALKTSKNEIDAEKLLEDARLQEDISRLDLVGRVTSQEVKRYGNNSGKRVAILDCGMKLSILRDLLKRGCDVTVFPAKSTASRILDSHPDGVVVSNGPGDPKMAGYAIDTITGLMEEKTPIFGICLGHQLLSLAVGADTYKLKFGHRGSNQPVKDIKTGKVNITSQNHGFAVTADSLKGTGFRVSHINLNDNTVEGMKHEKLPFSSVQYHPEAHPGPHDNEYLFDEFLESIGE